MGQLCTGSAWVYGFRYRLRPRLGLGQLYQEASSALFVHLYLVVRIPLMVLASCTYFNMRLLGNALRAAALSTVHLRQVTVQFLPLSNLLSSAALTLAGRVVSWSLVNPRSRNLLVGRISAPTVAVSGEALCHATNLALSAEALLPRRGCH